MFFEKWFAKNKRSFLITAAFLVLSTILIIVMFYRNSITVKIDQLTLYENPSAAAKEADTIKKGSRLSIIDQEHGWYQLRREDNEDTGWIPSWIINNQDVWKDKEINRLSLATVVLDAGHGGSDPGSIAVLGHDDDPSFQEKTYTLKMVQAIKKEVEKTGARVILTRDDDSFVNIHKIPDLAIENSADAFISVHFDSTEPVTVKKPKASSNKSVSGPETPEEESDVLQSVDITPSSSEENQPELPPENNSQESSENPAEAESEQSKEDEDAQEEEEVIVPTLATGFETYYYHNNGSKELSATICDALDGNGLTNRGSRKAEYVVIKENPRPATLLELGFINNGEDFSRIKSEKYRITTAKKVREGLNQYFDKVAPKLKYSAVQNSK